MDNFDRRAGETLRALRRAAGMSQTDMAGALTGRGIPFQQQTVLKVEKGTRPLRFSEACAVADILGVPVAALTVAESDSSVEAHDAALRAASFRQAVAGKIAELNDILTA